MEEQTVGGVDIVLARMDTHPEEFYGEEKKWAFIYKEYFRDVMTEIERGQLFEKLKKIRRQEFNERVMTTLVPPEEEQEESEYIGDMDEWTKAHGFGSAPVKREGSRVVYDGSKKVSLSASEFAMATKLGVTPQEYAKKKRLGQ